MSEPFQNVVDLSRKRPPVCYTLTITHHWDNRVEIFVQDVSDDERSREAVGHVIGLAALAWGSPPIPQADAINRLALERIDALMPALSGTKEADELRRWAAAVQEYEAARFSPMLCYRSERS